MAFIPSILIIAVIANIIFLKIADQNIPKFFYNATA